MCQMVVVSNGQYTENHNDLFPYSKVTSADQLVVDSLSLIGHCIFPNFTNSIISQKLCKNEGKWYLNN